MVIVRLIYKNEGQDKIKTYRPVSIPNIYSMIYERFLHSSLTNFADNVFTFYSYT